MRVAVIGLGRMGYRHVQAIQSLGFQVAGLCDSSVEAGNKTCSDLGVSPSLFFEDASALWGAVSPQAVVVSTTAPSHHDLVCAAARNGAQYILCEKPLATSLAEAESMLETCKRQGATLAVNHQMRFMPQVVAIKAALGTAELGGLVSVLVAGANFGLAMNGSHYFEMFRYLSGEPIKAVQAWLDEEIVPNPRGVRFQDRAGRVRAVTPSGRSMYIDCPAAAGHGVQLVFICRHGHLMLDELSGFMRIVRRQEAYRDFPTTRYGMPGVEDIQTLPAADVITPTMSLWKAMLAGEDFPSGLVGRDVVGCLCAAYTSNDLNGALVTTDDARIDRKRRYLWA